MSLSFKASMIGPSRVGKTTLLTAILTETESLLSGTDISLVLDEPTENAVRQNQKDLRRAMEAREFDAASLGGTQSMFTYNVGLQAVGDTLPGIPFSILDYPGMWLDPVTRSHSAIAKTQWTQCETHITHSLMLLVPIEAAVLMEAVTPAQRGAAADLLGFVDVETVARKWARARNLEEHRSEPAVLVLAPLKCEKYFDDNGGRGREAARLRSLVREKYRSVLDIVRAECKDRSVRVVYAPVDTYGCVELMECQWLPAPGNAGETALDFKGHYRFRGLPPQLSVKGARTVMQELCQSVISGEDQVQQQRGNHHEGALRVALNRHSERKGFWGTLDYYLSGESGTNRATRFDSQQRLQETQFRRRRLRTALQRIASVPRDARVEEW
ncbi:hypothetical protein ACWGDT_00135 [Streptomyces avermitilis]